MKTRDGFTLIELVISMSILLIVMLTLITLTGRTVHITAVSEREQAAIQLATDRTDEIRTNPDYGGLDTTYAGTETGFATLLGFSRTTTIVRTTAGGHDYKKITVLVTGPGLTAGVRRTIVVAAP
jgi:prepilin-type N-terminal cleavage/methylation domain-containing protein